MLISFFHPSQVVRDEFMGGSDVRSEALFAQCLQAVLHATEATSAHAAATLLACMIPPVSALKPLQLALQVLPRRDVACCAMGSGLCFRAV